MTDKKQDYIDGLYVGDDKPLLENGEPFFIKKGKVGCLLCHGFTGTPYEMKGIGKFLADNGITVLGLLLPGHGTTLEDMKKTTTTDYYEELTNAFNKLKEHCNEIFACGLSLGGVLSLKLASENTVQGVIPLATPVKFKKLEGLFLAIMGFLLKKAAIRKSKEEKINQNKYNIVCYDKYPIGPAVSLRKTILKTRKQLPEIKSPILIVQGIFDGKWIVDSSRIIFNEVSSEKKELVLLQKTSHTLTLGPEKEKVHELILKFIQKNSS